MIIVSCLAIILLGGSVLGQFLLKEVSCESKYGDRGVCKNFDDCDTLDNDSMSISDSDESRQCDGNKICCPPSLDNQDLRCGLIDRKRGLEEPGTFPKPAGGNIPWIAALGYKPRTKNKRLPPVVWNCAGSLINKRYVLTAASCVRVPRDVPYHLKVVRLGEYDLLNDTDGAHPVDYDIKHTIVHGLYSPREKINDIALIRLKREVVYTDDIYPICLPTPSLTKTKYDHKDVLEVGWGAYKFEGHLRNSLHQIILPKINHRHCSSLYSSEGYVIRNDKQVCAGNITNNGHFNCVGDVGGPLITFGDIDRFYLLGLFSFGDHCRETGLPRVYTRVSGFLCWISANTVDK